MLENTSIYQINLDHRTDRWRECVANHAEMGFAPGEIVRVSASLETGYAPLGCSKSHLKVLATFMADTSRACCMVLEDDFDFRIPKAQLWSDLQRLEASGLEWDVILLTASKANACNSELPGFARVFESLTTAGYIVKRSYVPQLLASFLESVVSLEKYKGFSPRELVTSRFACDVVWQRLQRLGMWLIPVPAVGEQRPSYSDIEGKLVDYSSISL